MEQKQRLTGIDLFRGIAAYAVVILHSDESVNVQSTTWSAILQFSSFAVPFFLAASFYLTINKLAISGKNSWSSRLYRLLIPYGLWSLIYLVQKIIKYAIKQEPDQIKELFQEPLALIFLGQSAFHLYFIPLLLTGSSLIVIAQYLLRKRVKLKGLFCFFVISIIIYEIFNALSVAAAPEAGSETVTEVLIGLNSFDSNVFKHLVLVELGYMVRCLPYIAVALLLNYSSIQRRLIKFNTNTTGLLLVIFLLINTFNVPLLPQIIYEVARGYSALLLAIALSTYLQANTITNSISACSFGIYLMHLLIVELFSSVAKKMNLFSDQTSIFILIALATLSFLVSWAITFVLMQKKPVAKLMFGV